LDGNVFGSWDAVCYGSFDVIVSGVSEGALEELRDGSLDGSLDVVEYDLVEGLEDEIWKGFLRR
jgi:hypothetical protein